MTETTALTGRRPGPTEWAAAGWIIGNVLIQLSVFLPPVGDSLDSGVKAVSVVFAVVAAIGAWGLWIRRTWGRRVTLVVTVLNVLSSAPALLESPSGALVVAVLATLIIGIPLVVLLLSGRLKHDMGLAA